MTIQTFMAGKLEDIKIMIAKELPDKFDSHDFIRCFSKKFELDYAQLLRNYDVKPFRNLHAQIALSLVKYMEDLKIQKNGKVESQSIFGNEVENEEWIKVK